MKKLLLLPLLLILAGCVGPSFAEQDAYKSSALERVREKLISPSTAKFDRVFVIAQHNALPIICGGVHTIDKKGKAIAVLFIVYPVGKPLLSNQGNTEAFPQEWDNTCRYHFDMTLSLFELINARSLSE